MHDKKEQWNILSMYFTNGLSQNQYLKPAK